MSPVSLLLNVLWIVFGGLWMSIGWLVAAVIMAITIIGIPWARAAFNIASYTMLPFGRKAVSRAEHLGTQDIGTGPLGFIGNLIWLILAGLVACARPSPVRDHLGRDDRRHSVRLGAFEISWDRVVAGRQDDCR